jgi:hypothetical protein
MAAKDNLETSLKNIFKAMKDMDSGGDDYFAEQAASAIDTYVKSLGIPAGSVIIQVTGQAAGVANTAPIALDG